jgi:hypothetical protein
MARVPLVDPVFYATVPATFARDRDYFLYGEDGETLASVHDAKSAGSTVALPLRTNEGGIPLRSADGSLCWVEPGEYIREVDGQRQPVVIGTGAGQPLDTDLTAIAALAPEDGAVIIRSGGSWTQLAKGGTGQQLVVRNDGTVAWTDAPTFNVKAWGAVGNGTTDDAAAIQAAINAASTAGGGLVNGFTTHKIGSTVEPKANVSLKGAGPRSKITLANGANCDMFKSANAGSGGADFSLIEDLWLDGNKTNNASGGRGVDLDGRRTYVNRLWISNCKSDGLRIRRSATQLSNAEGASDQIVTDAYAFNNDGNGIVSETNDASFSHCRAAANALAGFLTAAGSSATVFNDCHAWGAAEYGFNMEGSFDCVNCQAEGASDAEVRVTSGGRWIGGRVFVAGTPANVPGFLIVENTSTLVTRGVLIKETGTGGAFKALGASAGSGSSFDFLLEGGESVAFTKAEGASWSTNIAIEPILRGSTKIGEPPGANTIASANELTLTSNNRFFAISGTTEVKKIKATYAGHIVTLRFTSTAKIVDGENLKLAGSFEGAADRTITLACDATNWYETGRSTN